MCSTCTHWSAIRLQRSLWKPAMARTCFSDASKCGTSPVIVCTSVCVYACVCIFVFVGMCYIIAEHMHISYFFFQILFFETIQTMTNCTMMFFVLPKLDMISGLFLMEVVALFPICFKLLLCWGPAYVSARNSFSCK